MKTSFLFLFCSAFLCACQFFRDNDRVVDVYGSEGDTSYIQFNTLKFRHIPFVDSIITNHEFLNLLVPTDYKVVCKKYWIPKDYVDPFKYQIQLYDTGGTNIISFFPALTMVTHTTSKPINVRSINPYNDSLYESSNLPRNALDALMDYIIPIYAPEASNHRVVYKKPLYNIHQIDEDGKDIEDETACIHIEYTEGEKSFDHILYASLEKRFIRIESYNSTCEWRIKNIVSIKSVKGLLDFNLSIFQTVINSAKTSPSWAYYYNYLCHNNFRNTKSLSLTHYQHLFKQTPPIADAHELTIYHTYQNILRKTFAAYTMYLNNIEFYIDKDGTNVALPKGYIAAWSSTGSELLVTEVPNFKPDMNSEIAWVQIRKNESQMLNHFLEGSSAPEVGDPLFENDLYH